MKKIIIIAITIFSLIGCTENVNLDETNTQHSIETRHVFSGEDMYKSIFFFQGEFGKQINSLKDINKQFENLDLEVTNTLNDFVVNIIKGINELDDSYFGELENAVYSNDVQSIENALEKGQQLTIVASTLHSNSKEVKETEKSKLLSLAKTYDLSNESQFVSFMEDVNKTPH